MQSASPTEILTKDNSFQEGNWVWVRNFDPVEFFDWKQGQPDDQGGIQNCLHIKVNYGFQWDDFNCNAVSEGSNPFKPLCQKKL